MLRPPGCPLRGLLRAAVYALCFVLFGCADATQVRVIVDADPAVAGATVSLRVRVFRQEGDVFDRVVALGDDARYPFEVPLVPVGGDASREFLVVAEALDGEGRTLAVQRAQSRFASGQTRYLSLRFEDSCGAISCGSIETCRSGACRSACVSATESPDVTPASAACWLRDAGTTPVDASIVDAGPGDAGGRDAGPPDAGPPPGCDLSGALTVQRFESRTTWPTCPSFDSPSPVECTAIVSATLRVVDAVGADGPGSVSICGGSRVMRAQLEEGSNVAHLALPVASAPTQLHLRGWFYLPSAGFAAIVAAAPRNVSLLAIGVDSNLGGGGELINLRWASGLPFIQYVVGGVQRTSGLEQAYPADRWTCLELSYDTAAMRVQAAIDGVLQVPATMTAELHAALLATDAIHVRGGLTSAPSLGVQIWMDDLVVSTERIPCPLP